MCAKVAQCSGLGIDVLKVVGSGTDRGECNFIHAARFLLAASEGDHDLGCVLF